MQVGDPNDPELGPQVAAAMSEIIDYFAAGLPRPPRRARATT